MIRIAAVATAIASAVILLRWPPLRNRVLGRISTVVRIERHR